MTQAPKPRATLKTWLLRLTLIVTAPIVALLLIEAAWQLIGDPRYRDYEAFLATRPPHFQLAKMGLLRADPDPEISFTLRPGFDETIADNRYRVNELGLRGGPIRKDKAPGSKRVLVLGDSFAFGFGVDEKDTISSQLEHKLGVECLNMGVPGYQTGQEAARLQRDGLALAPDVVVLVYYANDCLASTFLYDPRIKVVYTDELGLPIGLKRFLARSILYSRLTKGYTAWLESKKAFAPEEHWALTRERLVRIQEMLRARGVRLVLAAIPTLDNSTDFINKGHPFNQAHDKVLAFAKERGIPVADMRKELLARGKPIEFLFVSPPPDKTDSHLTGDGYAILVDLIAAQIHAHRMLD